MKCDDVLKCYIKTYNKNSGFVISSYSPLSIFGGEYGNFYINGGSQTFSLSNISNENRSNITLCLNENTYWTPQCNTMPDLFCLFTQIIEKIKNNFISKDLNFGNIDMSISYFPIWSKNANIANITANILFSENIIFNDAQIEKEQLLEIAKNIFSNEEEFNLCSSAILGGLTVIEGKEDITQIDNSPTCLPYSILYLKGKKLDKLFNIIPKINESKHPYNNLEFFLKAKGFLIREEWENFFKVIWNINNQIDISNSDESILLNLLFKNETCATILPKNPKNGVVILLKKGIEKNIIDKLLNNFEIESNLFFISTDGIKSKGTIYPS